MAGPRPSSERPIKKGLYKSPYEPGGISQEVSYIGDEILIKYKDTATATEIKSFETAQGLDRVDGLFTGFIWYITPTDPLLMTMGLQDNPIIEFIEPNLVRGIVGSEVIKTSTVMENNLKTGSLIGFAVVLGILFLLRK